MTPPKRCVGRPKGKRPVIAIRIDPLLYEEIVKSATKRKITIASEAANRLQQSFGKLRMGRPVVDPIEGERAALGLRVRPEIKRLIEKSAVASGRSQSQEAELRIEQSYRDDDLVRRIIEAIKKPPQPRDN